MKKLHNFQTVEELKNSIKKVHQEKLQELTNNNFYIYGTKGMGLDVFECCSKLGYMPKGFIDNKSSLTEIEGLPVVSLKKTDLSTNPLIIIAARIQGLELKQSLTDIEYTNYISGDTLLIMYSSILKNAFTGEMLNTLIENQDDYIECRSIYTDPTSISIFDNIVNFRLTTDEQYLKNACTLSKEVYFEFKDITCAKNAVFVDGGGFDGETTIDFINHCPDKQYKKVYYFEPDSLNMEHSKNNLNSYNNIEYIQKGLYSHKDTLFFDDASEQGSAISDKGTSKIEVTSLDAEIHEPISFIKLDIESAELPALKGAHRHISEDTPVIAVCIYHTPEEFYTIPLYLHKKYGDKYDFHLRHYSYGVIDTVLYAIPKSIK